MSRKILTPSNNPEAFNFRNNVRELCILVSTDGFATKQFHRNSDSWEPIIDRDYGFFMQGENIRNQVESEVYISLNVGHTNAWRAYYIAKSEKEKLQAQEAILDINRKIVSIVRSSSYKCICFQDLCPERFYLTEGDFRNEQSGVNNLQSISQRYVKTFVPTHNFNNPNLYIESGTLTFNNQFEQVDYQNVSIIPDIITLRSYKQNKNLRIGLEKDGQFEIAYNTTALWAQASSEILANKYGSFLSTPKERRTTKENQIAAFINIKRYVPNSKLTCLQDENNYGELVDSRLGLKKIKFITQLVAKIITLGKLDPNAEGKKFQKLLSSTEYEYLIPKDYTFLGESKIQELAMKILRYNFDTAIVDYPSKIEALRDRSFDLNHRPTVVTPL